MESDNNNNNNNNGVKYPYPIKTVVVLVQENRSFDHILGWMKQLNPDIDGVTGHEFNPVNTLDPDSGRIYFKDESVYVDPDPPHSFQDIYEQVFGEPWSEENVGKLEPKMQGFVQNANRKEPAGMGEVVMNGFKPEHVPVYKELVTQFAVCDRWFASLPASTQPNRQFLHSATSHGLIGNDGKKLRAGMPQKTIFDSLHESGYTFGIYFQAVPTTLFYGNLRHLKYARKFHQFDLKFNRHCKKGKLPNYVVIEQRYFDMKLKAANDDHPSHDISEGQRFVKQVYESLRLSPQWNEMLFIITYDEHGGFYDHVPTPTQGVPNPDDLRGGYDFKFDRLGVRVPALLISPWIQPGTVLHRPTGPEPTSQYEHSSIPATVKKLFNLKNFLTKRDAWAGTLEVVLNRTSPRTDCPETLPDPVKLREFEAKEDKEISDFQEEIVQLATVFHEEKEEDNDDQHKAAVEKLSVAQGADYCHRGLKRFMEMRDKIKHKKGVDHGHGDEKNTTLVKEVVKQEETSIVASITTPLDSDEIKQEEESSTTTRSDHGIKSFFKKLIH